MYNFFTALSVTYFPNIFIPSHSCDNRVPLHVLHYTQFFFSSSQKIFLKKLWTSHLYQSSIIQLSKEDDFLVKSNIPISIIFYIFLSSSQYRWPLLPSWNTSLPRPSLLHYTPSCLMSHSNSFYFAGFSMRSLIFNQCRSSFLYLPSHILWLLIPLKYFWLPKLHACAWDLPAIADSFMLLPIWYTHLDSGLGMHFTEHSKRELLILSSTRPALPSHFQS